MIITRTPLRVSLAGGGTDFPAWYEAHGGAVVGFALAQYVYLTVRKLPPFFVYKHRIVYSKIELASSIADIEHPAVAAILADQLVEDGLEIHYDGDIPARSGMGSSSSFTVGLLHALAALRGRMVSRRELAAEAIRVEQRVMGEAVGSQDQIFAAFGGFNRIDFNASGFRVTPLVLPPGRLPDLLSHLMLVFTGFQRYAVEVEARKIATLDERAAELTRLRAMVDEVQAILVDGDFAALGRALGEGWELKRSLASGVSSPTLDAIYDRALDAGAIGGKLLGAGAGGFFLLVVAPAERERLRGALAEFVEVPIRVDHDGSRVVVYEPNGFGYR